MKGLKLYGSLSTQNLVLFDSKDKLCRYKSQIDILKDWFSIRTTLYERRKAYMVSKLEKQCEMLVNKVRFITAIIN